MDVLTKADLRALLRKKESPCLSLYLPTHRAGSEQDHIRWKNLLGEVKKQLDATELSPPQIRKLLAPAQRLARDVAFWKRQGDGLAYFQAPGWTRSYHLPASFTEQVVVGDRFHVKPLIPLLNDNGQYFILTLSQNHVRFLRGDAYALGEVAVKGLPKNLAETLQFHDSDEPLIFHTHPAAGLGRRGAIFHGHGVGIDDAKDDLLGYFRAIDRALHSCLRMEHAPLILAGVEYLWPLYREANTYPHLLDEGIAGNADHANLDELRQQAWTLVRPFYQQKQYKAATLFAQLAGTDRASNDVAELIAAAAQGRLEFLFVASDREQWGILDEATGAAVLHDSRKSGDDEMLNRAAADTLAHGGTVYVVPSMEVPGSSLLAGTYWLPVAKKGG
jgi:hypothetical protein